MIFISVFCSQSTMAVLAAAALLDELMGRNRNIAPNEKGRELNWEDPEVSTSYKMHFSNNPFD